MRLAREAVKMQVPQNNSKCLLIGTDRVTMEELVLLVDNFVTKLRVRQHVAKTRQEVGVSFTPLGFDSDMITTVSAPIHSSACRSRRWAYHSLVAFGLSFSLSAFLITVLRSWYEDRFGWTQNGEDLAHSISRWIINRLKDTNSMIPIGDLQKRYLSLVVSPLSDAYGNIIPSHHADDEWILSRSSVKVERIWARVSTIVQSHCNVRTTTDFQGQESWYWTGSRPWMLDSPATRALSSFLEKPFRFPVTGRENECVCW